MKSNEKQPNNLEEALEKISEINKQHIAELVFFEEEVKFLRVLLQKYFIAELPDEHIHKCQAIDDKLIQLGLVKANIARDALLHQGNLQMMLKDVHTHSVYFFELENVRIEEALKDINRNFKHIKKEIFQLSKEMIGFEPATDTSNESILSNI